jgi:ABC-type antimicrobial peptide transport system permease subunit
VLAFVRLLALAILPTTSYRLFTHIALAVSVRVLDPVLLRVLTLLRQLSS